MAAPSPPSGVVDPESRINGVIEDLDGAPCDAMLARVDPSSGADEFAVLQLIQSHRRGASNTPFVVYSRWGATGTAGRSLEQKFYGLGAAASCFENEFKLKTGLDWKDRGDPPAPGGRYRFVVQDFAEKWGGYAGGLWQYWVADGIDGKATGWYDYSDSRQVERLFQEYASNGRAGDLSQRFISSGYFTYRVDFVQMSQTNVTHHNRKSRRIRRVDVAGRTFNAPVAPTLNPFLGASAPRMIHGASAPNITPQRAMIHGASAPNIIPQRAPRHFHRASAPPFMSAVRPNPSSSPAQAVMKYKAPRCLSNGIPPDALCAPPSSCNMKESCAICHCDLEEGPCVSLRACGHVFHTECIQLAFKSKPQCPVCRVSIGKPQGKSPSGTMTVSNSSIRCSGFMEDSILVSYNLPRGTQLGYHDHPGRQHGSKRVTAYLPNNADGQDLLRRLKFAFMHGLSFTVGTSITTGIADQCTWASIHHKTSPTGGSRGHGYPDPDYFNNCNSELDSLGVPPALELNGDGSTK